MQKETHLAACRRLLDKMEETLKQHLESNQKFMNSVEDRLGRLERSTTPPPVIDVDSLPTPPRDPLPPVTHVIDYQSRVRNQVFLRDFKFYVLDRGYRLTPADDNATSKYYASRLDKMVEETMDLLEQVGQFESTIQAPRYAVTAVEDELREMCRERGMDQMEALQLARDLGTRLNRPGNTLKRPAPSWQTVAPRRHPRKLAPLYNAASGQLTWHHRRPTIQKTR